MMVDHYELMIVTDCCCGEVVVDSYRYLLTMFIIFLKLGGFNHSEILKRISQSSQPSKI